MESENETCGVCSVLYDTDDHLPRVLINCGHTLCSSCLRKIASDSGLKRCPFDNTQFKKSVKLLEYFPVNFALLSIIEEKNRNTCQIHHGEKLVMFCLQDKVKICYACALFGEHKGHHIKMVNELKVKGMKTKKLLEQNLLKFEQNQLQKDQELDALKQGFLTKIVTNFEEIKNLLKEKELQFTKEADLLFDRSAEKGNRILLKDDVELTLEEIGQACQKEENLAILDQDFDSVISSLQPQDVQEEALRYSNQSSGVLDCMEHFFRDEAKLIKSFDLTKHKQQRFSSENCPENKPKFYQAKTLFVVCVVDECLLLRVKNLNQVELTVNLEELNKMKKIRIGLERYEAFFQGSEDFNFLSEVLSKLDHYTSLAVSFAPENLTDFCAHNLLTLFFCRIQHLVEIELSFEGCKIVDQPISFFCTNLLSRAVSLKRLSLKLTRTFISDESLFALAKSLCPFSGNLESFTLDAKSTAITDVGITKVFQSVLGVKELTLRLQNTQVTDPSLKVFGILMSDMKNLEKFVLNCSKTKITVEGVTAIFTGIPKEIKYLSLDFCQVKLPDEVVSLFEQIVCPKLELVEGVGLRLDGSGLEGKVSEILKSIKKEIDKRKKTFSQGIIFRQVKNLMIEECVSFGSSSFA